MKSDIEDEKERITNTYNQKIKNIEDMNKVEVGRKKEYLSAIMEEKDSRYKSLEA